MGELTLVTAPTVEPITTAEAKLHLKVSVTDDDTLIASLITAARVYIENITGVRMVTQTVKYSLDDTPEGIIYLPIGPIQSISSITATDKTGAVTTVSSSSYQLTKGELQSRIDLVDGQSWPSVSLRTLNGFEITAVAGWALSGSTPTTPDILKTAVRLLVAHYYENREAASIADIKTLPIGIDAIISQYRLRSMG